MLLAVASFVVAGLVTLWIVHSGHQHAHLYDHDLSGPQKFHTQPVPRIGGLGILAGVLVAGALLYFQNQGHGRFMLTLIFCASPAFLSGLAEDVTKNVSPRRRLFFTCVSAALAWQLIDGVVDRTGVSSFDWIVALPLVAFPLTVLAVAGVTNAVNIIDGFNGLAAMCVMMMLLAMGYVAFQVGDMPILFVCLSCVGAILGFFIWNFPAGLIFLGDGGAYFLGFVVAEIAILLFHRNPSVSPMFSLLVCIYPVFETLFSIYRKKFIRKMSPGVPDGVHLHMLVYKRLMRWTIGSRDAKALSRRNSMTSPYLWTLCMTSVIPATLFWNDTATLLVFVLFFAFGYVAIYWRIVRFRVPRWMVFRRR